MTPHPSYIGPLRRAARIRRVISVIDTLVILVAVSATGLILGHVFLRTLTALPTLTAPAIVPGCC